MNSLLIELPDHKSAFRPGDMIAGAAYWKAENPPNSVEVRLVWRTRGKGTEDVQTMWSYSFTDPKPEEARPFKMLAPEGPYSFSGKLISLIWGLELVIKPSAQSTQVEITISPTGKEVLLTGPASPAPAPVKSDESPG